MLLSKVWRRAAPATRTDRRVADYLEAYRRHTAAFVGLVLLGGGLGLAAGTFTHPEYAATATVLVNPTGVTDPNPGRDRAPAAVDLDTEVQLARSPAVVSSASSAVSISPAALRRHLTLSVPANSRVLRFRFTAAAPDEAARGANAVADAYLAQRLETAENVLSRRITRTSDQVAQIQKDLRAATDRLGDPSADAGDQLYAQSEVQVLTRQLTSASQRLQQARLTVVTPGRAILEAQPPKSGASPGPARRGLEGLMLGLLAACAAVALLGLRRRRVHGLVDVSLLLPDQAVATNGGARLLGHRPEDLVAGLARRLPQGGLVAVLGIDGQPSLAVTLAIARSVRLSHYRVLALVWPREQMSEPTLRDGDGLAEFLLDPRRDLRTLTTELDGVPFVSPGRQVHRAATGTSRRQLLQTLGAVRGQADYTFVQIGGARPQATAVAQVADAVVLVVRDQVTTAADVQQMIVRVGADRVLGVYLLAAPGLPLPRFRHPAGTAGAVSR